MNNSSLNNPDVVESIVDDNGYYFRYSDGHVEQGGIYNAPSSGENTIPFRKSVSKVLYIDFTRISTYQGAASGVNWWNNIIPSYTNSGFNVYIDITYGGCILWNMVGRA